MSCEGALRFPSPGCAAGWWKQRMPVGKLENKAKQAYGFRGRRWGGRHADRGEKKRVRQRDRNYKKFSACGQMYAKKERGGGRVQFPLEFEKRTRKYNQNLEELFLKSGKRAAIIIFDSRNNSGIAEKGGFCRTNQFPHFMEYGRRFRHRKAGGPFRCAPGWGKEPAESFRRIA